MSKLGFDTTPKPAFLLAMQHQKWTITGAVAELIDNSFGPGRGNAAQAWIRYDKKKHIIEALDNGVGMDHIGRLFQLGNTVGRTPGDIGMYGSGGTMALLWLAGVVELWTLRDGRVSHDRVNWHDQIKDNAFPVINDNWVRATLANTPHTLLELKHGTLIRIHLLDARSPIFPNNIQRELAPMFGPGLRLGKQLTWINIGGSDTPTPLAELLPEFNQHVGAANFDIVLEVHGEHLSVHGRVGVVDDLPQSKSVINVGFGARTIIRTRDCFSSRDGSEKYIGLGVTGWLDLGEGWQPYLATTKDEINDKPVWNALMGHVFEKIKSILHRVDSEQFKAEFDDMALELQQALNGSMRTETSGGGPGKRFRLIPKNEEPGGIITDDPGDNPSDSPPNADDGENKDNGSAICAIQINRSTDEVMQGTLCKAQISNGGKSISVFVNKDHTVVEMALRAKPINKMALHLMITREMATEIIEHEDMVRSLFKQKQEQIDGLEERDRPRYISRMLMDRMRGKNYDEDVA